MRKLAFAVEYDGSDFKGWQFQPQTRTVQSEVDAALSFVADHSVTSVCAGRTDAGVHASGQIIHMQTSVQRTQHQWLSGVNSRLPSDVNLRWCKPVSDDFHARFSAQRRSYRYVIQNRSVRSALLRQRATWIYKPLDAEKMHLAAQSLLGEHDFTSFRSSGCQSKTAVRQLKDIRVHRKGEFVYLDVTANAFLLNMVRIIAGTLISVGAGERAVTWVADLLIAKDRKLATVTAPPEGLYLVKVNYPPQFNLPDDVSLPEF